MLQGLDLDKPTADSSSSTEDGGGDDDQELPQGPNLMTRSWPY